MTRTVLIAGSSRGIGAAAARREAANGSRVILHGRSDSPALKELSVELARPRTTATARMPTRSRNWSTPHWRPMAVSTP